MVTTANRAGIRERVRGDARRPRELLASLLEDIRTRAWIESPRLLG